MTQPYTSLDEVIDGLLAIFAAATTVPVDDGSIASSDAVPTRVLVGGNGVDEPGELAPAGQSSQDPVTFEDNPADEAGTVQCAIRYEAGDDESTSMADGRAATKAVLVELEAAVRADKTLGGRVANAWISSADLVQGRPRGVTVIRPFTVSYEALQE